MHRPCWANERTNERTKTTARSWLRGRDAARPFLPSFLPSFLHPAVNSSSSTPPARREHLLARSRSRSRGRPVVVARHERHLRRDRGALPPARLDLKLRPGFGERFLHVSHRDVLAEHGGEPAGGDFADFRAVHVEDLAAASRGRALTDFQADAAPVDAVRELLFDDVAADEIARVSAGFSNRPRQPSLDRADAVVQVVAVQTQARFQAKRVARAEAAEPRRRVLEQLLRERDGVRLQERDLESILPRVPRPRQPHRLAVHGGLREHPKVQLIEVQARAQGLEHVHSLGALEREQRSIGVDDELHVHALRLGLGEVRVDMRLVLGRARAVQHDVDVLVGDFRDDGVVDDSAVLVRDEGQSARAVLQRFDVADDERLGKRDGVLPADGRAEHVGDVEQGRGRAAVLRRFHDGVGVLDRHAVPGERDLEEGEGRERG
eukprot:31185-Pelagococcus_subviridis.AAC.8